MRTTFFLPLLLAAAALPLGAPRAVPQVKRPAPPAEVAVRADKDHIDFFAGKALVTRYVLGPKVAKPYFWPLHAPSGAPLTRPWPMGKLEPGEKKGDHPHQKSAWFCHGDVIPEGLKLAHKIRGVTGVDFWSEAPGHGRIVCTKVDPPKVAGNHGQVTTYNEWRTADGTKVLDEVRTIHLYNFGEAWLLVLDTDLSASVVAITFGDTKEGSLGVRVRDVMRADKKGQLTNAEGKSGEGKRGNVAREGCWGLRSAWCDYSGPTGGTTAGVAIFADPTNVVPTAWHSRNYGLMAANPFGRAHAGFPDTKGKTDLVKLAKGEHLKLRYGLFLHTGDVKEGKVGQYYERFTRLRAGAAKE
jgi:hypothetical protein